MCVTMRAVMVVALFAAASMGCVTELNSRVATLPHPARVGVLLADSTSSAPEATLRGSYVYTAMVESGLYPVALNDIDVTRVIRSSVLDRTGDSPAASATDDVANPALLGSLRKHFEQLTLDYVLIVYVDSWALDRDMRAVVVRVKDMSVVASRHYKRRTMGPLCVPLSFVFGASLLVCPWFLFIDKDEANYEMVKDFLSDIETNP